MHNKRFVQNDRIKRLLTRFSCMHSPQGTCMHFFIAYNNYTIIEVSKVVNRHAFSRFLIELQYKSYY